MAFERLFRITSRSTSRAAAGGWLVIAAAAAGRALAAAAFWFLAPASLKARVGLAEAGGTQLQVMVTEPATASGWPAATNCSRSAAG